ncbi:Protein PATRONUS 2 [Heracleum sosnowskyi]|uniref:Protein PATRONUS 2 n=1 Tax=Heracleum sosnowskyi TaxID=360622 RepID=A0AAD8J2I5_9APIA|nr:Protein PATRONUS 2 [Heracleum sosnowskyi]
MTTYHSQRPLIIQDENLGSHLKKKGIEGTIKSSKPAAKKGQVLGTRKALNDITNKSSLHPSVSTKKKSAAKEEFNIAGEKFLHDHTKCIEANQKAMESSFWETVFPKHGTLSDAVFSESMLAKNYPESPRCNPEPVELPMSEFVDWLQPSSEFDSLSSSPIHWDSPPASPFRWDMAEHVEFVLKEEIDC